MLLLAIYFISGHKSKDIRAQRKEKREFKAVFSILFSTPLAGGSGYLRKKRIAKTNVENMKHPSAKFINLLFENVIQNLPILLPLSGWQWLILRLQNYNLC
jgi:hypothetical protein